MATVKATPQGWHPVEGPRHKEPWGLTLARPQATSALCPSVFFLIKWECQVATIEEAKEEASWARHSACSSVLGRVQQGLGRVVLGQTHLLEEPIRADVQPQHISHWLE